MRDDIARQAAIRALEIAKSAKAQRGEKGDKGDKGDPGDIQVLNVPVPGPTGERGPVGPTGPKGDRGIGDRGPKGDAGPQGPTGPKGDKGDRGEKGDAGRDGSPGLPGLMGIKGDTGPIGPMPKHEKKGLMIRFESEPGVWGKWITMPTGGGGGGRDDKLTDRQAELVALAEFYKTRGDNTNKFIKSDGTSLIWAEGDGTGTVTSVNTAGTVNGLTLTGGPITTSGTITLGGTLDLSSPPAIGSTTPAAGTFTTLTATGQTSLGGVEGSESLRVLVPSTVGGAYETVQAGSNYIEHRFSGSQPNISLRTISRGTGSISFYTNNTASSLQFNVTHTASAVNYVQVTGAATGGNPTITAQGSDTNIRLYVGSKGSSSVRVVSNAGTVFDAIGVSSAANYFNFNNAAASGAPSIAVAGSDTNIDLTLTTKGTGAVNATTGGGTQFKVTNTASAVNYVQVTGAATTGLPQITAQGSDTNPGLLYITKGIGEHRFASNASAANIQFRIPHTASAVNYGTVTGAAAGASPTFSVAGTDTNIDLTLTPKGTGNVRFGTYTGTALAIAGYIEIKDAGGTLRKLAVVA